MDEGEVDGHRPVAIVVDFRRSHARGEDALPGTVHGPLRSHIASVTIMAAEVDRRAETVLSRYVTRGA
ncbi:hypothetical protein [Streptomyces lavendulocolor]|uniref:hypothetical protein n=1 Tax=Streptomyces lavendulocolor TaxID=67316 RepID=UPI003404EE99